LIPFSGFVQANTFSASGSGGKTINPTNPADGLLEFGDTPAPFDDTPGSFLQWVQKMMDTHPPAETDGESVRDLEIGNHEADILPLDQLPVPIAESAESMDQPPVSQNAGPLQNGDSLEAGQDNLPPLILNTLRAHLEGSQTGDDHGRHVLSDLQTKQIQKNNPPAAGLTPSAADVPSDPILTTGNHTQNKEESAHPVKVNPLMPNLKDDVSIEKGGRQDIPVQRGGEQYTSIDMSGRQDKPMEIGSLNRTPNEMVPKQDASIERAGRENPLSLFKPAGPANEPEKTSISQVAQQGPPSGLGAVEKAIGATSAHGQQPFAGNTENPESIAGLQADEEKASSEEDTAHFRGGDKHGQTPRIAPAEVKESEMHKDQSLDSMKSTGLESVKSDASFQETARAISPEPPTTAAEKITLGQPAALTRPETPPAGTFQSTVMDQIVDKASLRSIHGRSEVQIRLKPEFLGNVQMNIATEKEQVVVRIITDQPVVKEIIETHLHHLKAELQNQGLTIDKFDVIVNPDADQQHSREQFSQMFKNNSSNDGRRRAHDQDPEKPDPEDGHGEDEPNREGVNYFA
jgi:Flagellar hook-length control protein FliK